MTDADHVRRMTPRGRAPASCPTHFGFPLPCVRCAPAELPRAESTKRMRPATTTAAARARRLDAVREAAERARAKRETATITAPEAQEEATMARGKTTEVTFKGRTDTVPEWATELKMSAVAVRKRVVAGVPLDAPVRPGAPSLAGTWDYARDCATGAEPKKRASAKPAAKPANRGAKPAKTIQAAKPRQPTRKAPVTEQQIAALVAAPGVVSEETFVSVAAVLGFPVRRVDLLGREYLVAELRGAA